MEANKMLKNSKNAIDGRCRVCVWGGGARGYTSLLKNTDNHVHYYGPLYRLVVPHSGNPNPNPDPIPRIFFVSFPVLSEIMAIPNFPKILPSFKDKKKHSLNNYIASSTEKIRLANRKPLVQSYNNRKTVNCTIDVRQRKVLIQTFKPLIHVN